MSNDPECIVLHCGTNDLKQNTSAVEIGQKIVELAVSCKWNSNIIISGIVPRRDKCEGSTGKQFSKK